jgi:hypothetical protein
VYEFCKLGKKISIPVMIQADGAIKRYMNKYYGVIRKIEHITGDNTTRVVKSFKAEDENPLEMQHSGWQAILDNFKKYPE